MGWLGKAHHHLSGRAEANLSVFKIRCLFQLSANLPPLGLLKLLLSLWHVEKRK